MPGQPDVQHSALKLTIAVTGHRDIKPTLNTNVVEQFSNLISTLRKAYPHLGLRLICGLASGSDQLLVKESLLLQKNDLPIEILGVLPMEKRDYLKSFNESEQTIFQELIDQIKQHDGQIIELSSQASKEESYSNLAHYLNNKADIIVAVWNGSDNNKLGGTSYVTGLAMGSLLSMDTSPVKVEQVQQSLNINSAFYGLESTLVYVIPVERVNTEQRISNFKQAGYWYPKESNRYSTSHTLSKEHERKFLELNHLSKEVMKAPDCHASSGLDYSCEDDGYKHPDLKRISNRFRQLDGVANRLSKQVNRVHRWLTVITLTLAFSFLVYAKLLPNHLTVLVIYVLIFIAGVIWFYTVKPNRLKARYALYRLASESLRIEFFAHAAGIKDEIGANSLAKKLHSYGMEEIEVVRSVIQQSSFLGKNDFSPIANDTVINDWLEAQRSFYKEKSHMLQKKHKKLHHALSVTIFLPILIAIALIAFYPQFYNNYIAWTDINLKSLAVFLIGFIPVLGALFELHVNNNSIKELSHQYTTFHKYIGNAISALKQTKTKGFLGMLQVISVELSSEQTRWAVTTKQKNMDPPSGG